MRSDTDLEGNHLDRDLLLAPVWCGVNLLLARGAWKLGNELFPYDDVLTRLLHAVILFWLCVVGCGVFLGALGILTATTLLVSGAILALVLSSRFLRSIFIVACHRLLFSAHSSATTEAPATQPEIGSGTISLLWVIVWVVVLAFWCGRLADGLLEVPIDWDTLMYHLPLVDHFLQTGGLYSRDCAVWYNPSANELFGLWFVAPFSGDFLILLTNLPAGVIFVIATIGLGRQIGLRSSLCHLTALAVLANFAVVRQFLDASNDLPVAAFVLAGLFYGLRYARGAAPPDLVLASACLGLGIGIKYYALGPALVVGVALVLASLFLRGLRVAIRVVVTIIIGSLLVGAFWYVRNVLMTGLPFYPMGLTPGNDPLTEMYPKPWQSTLLGNGSPEILPLVERALWQLAGPCHYLAFVLLPGTLLLLLGTAMVDRFRGKKTEGTIRLVFCFALVGTGLALGITPFGAETLPGTLNMLQGGYSPVRFGLCFYSLMVMAMALSFQEVFKIFARVSEQLGGTGTSSRIRDLLLRQELLRRVFQIGIAVMVVYQTFDIFQRRLPEDPSFALLMGANLLLAGWVVWLAWPANPRHRWVVQGAIGVGVCIAAYLAVGELSESWHASFTSRYDRAMGTSTFARMAALNSAETRVCVFTYRYYPFFGDRRQFQVCQPKRIATVDGLMEYLSSRDVDLFITINTDPFDNGAYRHGLEWARQNPRIFQLLYRDQSYSLFRVNRATYGQSANGPSAPTKTYGPDQPGSGS
jgi:hypothetical protein